MADDPRDGWICKGVYSDDRDSSGLVEHRRRTRSRVVKLGTRGVWDRGGVTASAYAVPG